MGGNEWTMALMGALIGAAAAGLLVFVLLGRQLKRLGAQLDHSEQARALLNQQNGQARKQVEHLQTELAEYRHSAALRAAPHGPKHALYENTAPGALEDALMGLANAPAEPDGDAFARTQIVARRKP